MLAEAGFLSLLADRLHDTPSPARVLFVFDPSRRRTDPQTLLRVLRHFDRAEAVEFARGAEQATLALDCPAAAARKRGLGRRALMNGGGPPSEFVVEHPDVIVQERASLVERRPGGS